MAPSGASLPCARGTCSPRPTLLLVLAPQEVPLIDLLGNPQSRVRSPWGGTLTTEPKSHRVSHLCICSVHLCSRGEVSERQVLILNRSIMPLYLMTLELPYPKGPGQKPTGPPSSQCGITEIEWLVQSDKWCMDFRSSGTK